MDKLTDIELEQYLNKPTIVLKQRVLDKTKGVLSTILRYFGTSEEDILNYKMTFYDSWGGTIDYPWFHGVQPKEKVSYTLRFKDKAKFLPIRCIYDFSYQFPQKFLLMSDQEILGELQKICPM